MASSVYATIVKLANDNDFINRLTACAAQEGIDNPVSWAQFNSWSIAAAPGFAAAYASGTDSGYASPGNREDVISDLQILAAVQAFMNAVE